MGRCLPLLPKELVGRQSYVVPRSENQFYCISNKLFSGFETEVSCAPLPSSSVYCTQRIMVTAKSFSRGLKALWPVLAHFSSRNQQELPGTNTALLLTPILKEEVCLSGPSSLSAFRGNSQYTISSLPGLLPCLEHLAGLSISSAQSLTWSHAYGT